MSASAKSDILSKMSIPCPKCKSEGKETFVVFTGVATPDNHTLVVRLYCPVHGHVGDWRIEQAQLT